MHTLFIASAACWVCALLARPRRPPPGTEVAELAYTRLLGHQQCLVFLAAMVTFATVFAGLLTLPSHMAAIIPPAEQICIGTETCYVSRPDGRWDMQERDVDGWWTTRDVVDAPAVAEPARGYG